MKLYIYLLICLIAKSCGKSIQQDGDVQQQQQPNLEAEDNGYVFQGDMIMTKKEIESALNGEDVDKARETNVAFGLQKSNYYKWKGNTVPYVLHSSVRNKALNIVGLKGPTEKVIEKAMNAWQNKTCIEFKQRTNEKDYVEFQDAGFGKCYSHVGRIGGKQVISLGFGCFTTGIAIHEIGHALGLHHEQSRPDRDDYVEILWDNIQSEVKYNFKKYSHSRVDSRGSPYDYDSIMHYEWNAFAKFPLFQRTIRAKQSGAKFGQRSHISVQDAIQINKYYQCK